MIEFLLSAGKLSIRDFCPYAKGRMRTINFAGAAAQIFCASGQSQAFFACVFAYDRTGNGH